MENITEQISEPISVLNIEPIVEPIVEHEPIVEQVLEPSIKVPESVPKVVQNSDFLYKSDIKWANNIEYIEPNSNEIEMLHGTKKPLELLEEEENKEEIKKTEEEIKQQRTKDLLLIFKVVSLNRLGHHPIQNTSDFQPSKLKEFLTMMNSLIDDFNKGLEIDITDEFNKICTEKLFKNNSDISSYPVYA